MKKILLGIVVMGLGLGLSRTGRADVTDLYLFTVYGSGRAIEYKARVSTSDCQFDQSKPTDVYMVEKSDVRPISWLEAHVLAFDYLERAATKIVAEVKYFEKNHIHWPVTLMVGKDENGRCQGAAIGDDSGEVIKSISIMSSEKDKGPTGMIVTGLLNGQPVQFPVTLN